MTNNLNLNHDLYIPLSLMREITFDEFMKYCPSRIDERKSIAYLLRNEKKKKEMDSFSNWIKEKKRLYEQKLLNESFGNSTLSNKPITNEETNNSEETVEDKIIEDKTIEDNTIEETINNIIESKKIINQDIVFDKNVENTNIDEIAIEEKQLLVNINQLKANEIVEKNENNEKLIESFQNNQFTNNQDEIVIVDELDFIEEYNVDENVEKIEIESEYVKSIENEKNEIIESLESIVNKGMIRLVSVFRGKKIYQLFNSKEASNLKFQIKHISGCMHLFEDNEQLYNELNDQVKKLKLQFITYMNSEIKSNNTNSENIPTKTENQTQKQSKSQFENYKMKIARSSRAIKSNDKSKVNNIITNYKNNGPELLQLDYNKAESLYKSNSSNSESSSEISFETQSNSSISFTEHIESLNPPFNYNYQSNNNLITDNNQNHSLVNQQTFNDNQNKYQIENISFKKSLLNSQNDHKTPEKREIAQPTPNPILFKPKEIQKNINQDNSYQTFVKEQKASQQHEEQSNTFNHSLNSSTSNQLDSTDKDSIVFYQYKSKVPIERIYKKETESFNDFIRIAFTKNENSEIPQCNYSKLLKMFNSTEKKIISKDYMNYLMSYHENYLNVESYVQQIMKSKKEFDTFKTQKNKK